MINNTLAPIIIFTYRRQIDKLIESLLKNDLSAQSELYIFSDGYKSDIDKKDVLDVRNSLKLINGFKKINIQEYDKNNGLARSVIDGVTSIINKYERVIVLEDDLVVSENFLNYMNEALEFYENSENIWSISGYTPTFECLKDYNHDVYLSLRASSWGWATWKNRWEKIDWEIKDWNIFRSDEKAIQAFNKGGNDLFKMLEIQMLGKIDSWAIRWCYSQFRNNAFTIYPRESKIVNIGFDEKGTHNSNGEERWFSTLSSKVVKFDSVIIDENMIDCFAKQYKLQLKTKIGYVLKKYGGYEIAKKIINFLKRA